MEFDQVKIAIFAISIIEIGIGAFVIYSGKDIDVGTVGMGIAAIAGLAGYDMKNKGD